jgi:hypothetical protein
MSLPLSSSDPSFSVLTIIITKTTEHHSPLQTYGPLRKISARQPSGRVHMFHPVILSNLCMMTERKAARSVIWQILELANLHKAVAGNSRGYVKSVYSGPVQGNTD